MTFGLRLMISSVAPTRLSTFYAYLITKIGNRDLKDYNNKILISKPGFNPGTNLKINFDEEKDKTDVKSKKVEIVKTKLDVKPKKEPDIKSNKEQT